MGIAQFFSYYTRNRHNHALRILSEVRWAQLMVIFSETSETTENWLQKYKEIIKEIETSQSQLKDKAQGNKSSRIEVEPERLKRLICGKVTVRIWPREDRMRHFQDRRGYLSRTPESFKAWIVSCVHSWQRLRGTSGFRRVGPSNCFLGGSIPLQICLTFL